MTHDESVAAAASVLAIELRAECPHANEEDIQKVAYELVETIIAVYQIARAKEVRQ